MPEFRLRTVDAFADTPFTGNPAAVVVLDEAPTDDWMAKLAREMNLSETAFVIRETLPDADFRLRWFTPTVEIDLCGHATLAAAHCLFEDGVSGPIRFATRSGVLTVDRRPDGSLAMDFPASAPVQIDPPPELTEALGVPIEWAGRSDNGFLLTLVADERAVRRLSPDISAVARFAAFASSSPLQRIQVRRTTSSPASLRQTSASTRIRSPARPMPSLPPTGRIGSAERR